MDNCAQRRGSHRWKTLRQSSRPQAAPPRYCPRSRQLAFPLTASPILASPCRLRPTRKGPTYPRRVRPRHPHHDGLWIDDTVAELEHLGLDTPPGGQQPAQPPRSRRGPLSLHGHQGTRRRHQGHRPTRGAARAEPRRATSPRRTPPSRAGPRHGRARPARAQAQLGHDLVQERRPPQQRLHQRHRDVRSRDRHDQAGKAGARCRCRRRVAPGGIASARTAQLSTCRSQSRAASRGPISPRSTPSVASSSA